jgi:hypothetical protein
VPVTAGHFFPIHKITIGYKRYLGAHESKINHDYCVGSFGCDLYCTKYDGCATALSVLVAVNVQGAIVYTAGIYWYCSRLVATWSPFIG